MLTASRKRTLRHISLAGIALSLPLMYLGSVTIESAAMTIAGLVVAGVTAVIAWLVF